SPARRAVRAEAAGPGAGAAGAQPLAVRAYCIGMFERLHHIQLLCPPGGEDEARAFYAGVLGMAELAKPPVLAARGGCWFRGGGWEVHLGVEDPFAPALKAHPGLLVAGLGAVAAALERAGHPVT